MELFLKTEMLTLAAIHCFVSLSLYVSPALKEPLGLSLTVRPLIDRMGAVARERRVQVFPQYVEFVLQVDEEHISGAAGTP